MKRFIFSLIFVLIVPILTFSQTITRVKIGPIGGISESKLEGTLGSIPTYSYGVFMVMDRIGLEIKKVKPISYKFPKLITDNFYSDFDGTTYTLNYNLYTGSSVSFAWGGGIYVEDYEYVQIPLNLTKGRQISYFGSLDMMFDLSRRTGFSLGGELGYQYKSVNLGLYINL